MLRVGFQRTRNLTILICTVLIVLHIWLSLSLLWLLFPLFLFLSSVIYGSAIIESQFFLETICQVKTKKKQIALSFDDGPNSNFTPLILETLRKYGVKATFFVIGKHIADNQKIVRQIDKEGHLIGNHSFSHSIYLPFKSSKALMKEIEETNALVFDLIGKKLRYFRPPFGVTSPPIANAVNNLGMRGIGWSIRSLDTTSNSAEKITERVIRRIDSGKIILLHDTFQKTNTILVNILEYCKREEIEVVSMDHLINKEAYV